jgi:hypothetical protein
MYSRWNNTYSTWNYRKINKNQTKYSAGILPYTFDQFGKCFFLLGKDNENDWSDFGGRCEFRDRNEPLNTATREFYEETLGSVLTIEECKNKLELNPIKIISKTLNGSPYYMYLMHIENSNYLESFTKTSQFLRYQFDKQEMNKLIEKNTMRWVSIDTILLCIENEQQNTPIHLRGVFYNTLLNCRDQLQFLLNH